MTSTHAMTPGSTAPPSIVQQVRAEYLEMPGLRLTARQAARMWGLDVAETERVLGQLVEGGLLTRDAAGCYGRRSPRSS
jgi:hypothetical protein